MLHSINNLTKLSGKKIDDSAQNFHFFTEYEKNYHQPPNTIDYALRKRCYAFVTAAAASPSVWHWMYKLWQKLWIFSYSCATLMENWVVLSATSVRNHEDLLHALHGLKQNCIFGEIS